MKKLLTFTLLTVSLSSNAFFNNNTNGWNNTGHQEDNGIFGYNAYNFYDPRWYMKEMTNMIDEIDDQISNDNEYGYGNFNANPYALAPVASKDFPAIDTTKTN